MIRKATSADAHDLAQIYNFYIQNSVATFEQDDVTANDIIQRIEKAQSSGNSWLVAQTNERVVGYAYSARWSERAAYKHTVEVSVYLANSVVSTGWGTKLYSALFAELRERSVHTVIGGVSLPNPASVAIHEKFGMEKVAHFKEVGYKFGRWIDVGYWQVQLDTQTHPKD